MEKADDLLCFSFNIYRRKSPGSGGFDFLYDMIICYFTWNILSETQIFLNECNQFILIVGLKSGSSVICKLSRYTRFLSVFFLMLLS